MVALIAQFTLNGGRDKGNEGYVMAMRLNWVNKIWDKGAHNAFSDLTLFKQRLYCAFREGSAHVSPDGMIRVLASSDAGVTWHLVATLTHSDADLRDAKLVVFEGQLYLFSGATFAKGRSPRIQSYYWYSHDGCTWSKPVAVGGQDEWLWRITAHQHRLLGIAYYADEHDGYVRLYQAQLAEDALLDWQPLVSHLSRAGYVNEAGLSIDEQGVAYCLLRRDPLWQTDERALLGQSTAPYTHWQWRVLDKRIGGPVSFIYRQRLYAIVRLYDKIVRTSLVEIKLDTGTVVECLRFPSGGDTSYAGIVQQGDELLVSYYSSHEGKCALYFANVTLGAS